MEEVREQGRIDAEVEEYRYQKSEYDIIRYGEKQEQELYEMIRTGNIGKLEQRIQFYGNGTVEDAKAYIEEIGDKIGDFAIQNRKKYEYMLVVTITLARRAAVEGGMDYVFACDLSDIYLKLLENCKTVEEMIELQNQVIVDYTRRVWKLSNRKNQNQYVEFCKNWISRNITRPFDRKELAKELGLAPNYVSTMFQRETGMSLSEYRIKARLKASEHMLMYSDCTISEIAERFEFGSASNYGRYFRKRYGQSPSEYRKKNRKFNYDEG